MSVPDLARLPPLLSPPYFGPNIYACANVNYAGVNNAPSAASAPTVQKSTESLTKKQRQHAAKREAQKAAKADAEQERLATLAKHKRELERARMAEQAKTTKKTASGGMSAYEIGRAHV